MGISVTSSTGNQLTDNIVGTNTLGGISITSSTGNLTGNSVTGNLAFGISLSSVNGITLSENEISGNSSNGLVINGSANNINNNTIFNNTSSGVLVASGNHNSILNNSIYGNATLGTELAAGTNDSQQYPTLSTLYTWQDESALPEIKGGSSIQGVLNSTPEQNYKIQFFANSSMSNREGGRYLGEIIATTDIAGGAEFLANLKDAVLEAGEVVSATATKLDVDSLPLSTSEFSVSIERATDEGNHYLVNTTLAGIPLHWKDGEGDYETYGPVTAGGVQPPVGFAAAVGNGFNTWTELEQLTYTERALSSTNSGKWGGNADGINNIVWFPSSTMWQDSTEAPTNVIAVTRVRYNALNGEMIDIDMAFNGEPISLAGLGQFYWATDGSSDKLDVQNVATHEIGHYSGLADLYNPGDFNYTLLMKNNNQFATMYGRINNGETSKNSLSPGSTDPDWFPNQLDITKSDIGGINYIYNNLGDVYYDIVLVFDGTTNFTSSEALNGFTPSKNAALELVTKLRIGDRIGWVNGSIY